MAYDINQLTYMAGSDGYANPQAAAAYFQQYGSWPSKGYTGQAPASGPPPAGGAPNTGVNDTRVPTAQELQQIQQAIQNIAASEHVSVDEAQKIFTGQKPRPSDGGYQTDSTGLAGKIKDKPGLDWATLDENKRSAMAREDQQRQELGFAKGQATGKVDGQNTLESVKYANEILANPQNAALAEMVRKGYALGPQAGETVADYLNRSLEGPNAGAPGSHAPGTPGTPPAAPPPTGSTTPPPATPGSTVKNPVTPSDKAYQGGMGDSPAVQAERDRQLKSGQISQADIDRTRAVETSLRQPGLTPEERAFRASGIADTPEGRQQYAGLIAGRPKQVTYGQAYYKNTGEDDDHFNARMSVSQLQEQLGNMPLTLQNAAQHKALTDQLNAARTNLTQIASTKNAMGGTGVVGSSSPPPAQTGEQQMASANPAQAAAIKQIAAQRAASSPPPAAPKPNSLQGLQSMANATPDQAAALRKIAAQRGYRDGGMIPAYGTGGFYGFNTAEDAIKFHNEMAPEIEKYKAAIMAEGVGAPEGTDPYGRFGDVLRNTRHTIDEGTDIQNALMRNRDSVRVDDARLQQFYRSIAGRDEGDTNKIKDEILAMQFSPAARDDQGHSGLRDTLNAYNPDWWQSFNRPGAYRTPAPSVPSDYRPQADVEHDKRRYESFFEGIEPFRRIMVEKEMKNGNWDNVAKLVGPDKAAALQSLQGENLPHRAGGGGVIVGGQPHFIVDSNGVPKAALTEDNKPEAIMGRDTGVEVIPLDPVRRAAYEARKAMSGQTHSMAGMPAMAYGGKLDLSSLKGLGGRGNSHRTAPSRRPGASSKNTSKTQSGSRAKLTNDKTAATKPKVADARANNGQNQGKTPAASPADLLKKAVSVNKTDADAASVKPAVAAPTSIAQQVAARIATSPVGLPPKQTVTPGAAYAPVARTAGPVSAAPAAPVRPVAAPTMAAQPVGAIRPAAPMASIQPVGGVRPVTAPTASIQPIGAPRPVLAGPTSAAPGVGVQGAPAGPVIGATAPPPANPQGAPGIFIGSGGNRTIGNNIAGARFGFDRNAPSAIAGANQRIGIPGNPGVGVLAAHKIAPGTLRNMTSADRAMFESQVRASGQDPSSYFEQAAFAEPGSANSGRSFV